MKTEKRKKVIGCPYYFKIKGDIEDISDFLKEDKIKEIPEKKHIKCYELLEKIKKELKIEWKQQVFDKNDKIYIITYKNQFFK